MLAIRGIYDGKTFHVLPDEPLPTVQHNVPVAIIFLDEDIPEEDTYQRQMQVAQRMRAARRMMQPLGMSVKDLIEEGREHESDRH